MKIKFINTALWNAIKIPTGQTVKKHILANEVYEVEHVRNETHSHVSIWLKEDNIMP
jgi:hypothetical protein